MSIVGSLVLAGLVGCSRGWFEEREPWRHQAEVACLKSGEVKIGPAVAQLRPIEGPGMCGADFPLKVAALGEGPAMAFAAELRPPGSIPNVAPLAARPPADLPNYGARAYPQPPYQSQPVYQPSPVYQSQPVYQPQPDARYAPQPEAQPGAPLSLDPPGLEREDDAANEAAQPPAEGTDGADPRQTAPGAPRYSMPPDIGMPRMTQPLPRLGPTRTPSFASVPATVTPPATLACPIVSALDQWIATAVQPSAQRWFGQPVIEIKQISAYSCRGMNGNPRAHISEHAFGNALDIAAFKLADGRTVTVKAGWRGTPEEQGFLRDVQGAACERFSTVLAPGSNVFHYDHIHVDLMRRSSGRSICKPAAVPGEVVAARARGRNPFAQHFNRNITGALGPGRVSTSGAMSFAPEPQSPAAIEALLPRAIPGQD